MRRAHLGIITEGTHYEETSRRLPSISQGERPGKKAALPVAWSQPLASRTMRKFLLFQPPTVLVPCDGSPSKHVSTVRCAYGAAIEFRSWHRPETNNPAPTKMFSSFKPRLVSLKWGFLFPFLKYLESVRPLFTKSCWASWKQCFSPVSMFPGNNQTQACPFHKQ